MVIYNVRIAPYVPTSLNSVLFGIFPGSTRSFLLLEIDIEGLGSSSSQCEFGFYRTNNTSTVLTLLNGYPTDVNSSPQAFSGVSGQGPGTTAPTAGTLVHEFGLNAFGQRYFWRANPNLNNAILCSGVSTNNGSTSFSGGLILQQISGTPANSQIGGRIQIGEL